MNESILDTYEDPLAYDEELTPFKPEGTFLLDLAKQADNVLEIGCGTGRVTIPLAQQNINITGLDLMPGMLDRAKAKAGDLPINWVCADMCDFDLGQQFDLIFTYGAVFQHLHTRLQQEAMLARVHQHLAPGGRFILDIGFRQPKTIKNVLEEQDWYTYTDPAGREIQVRGTDEFDLLKQVWLQTYTRYWQEDGQQKQSKPIRLSLRYFMPQEIEALLHYNGFTVLERYSDWQGNPLTEKGFMQLYVCEKR